MDTGEGASAYLRGRDINERRLNLGIKSLHEFAEATGVSRKAITAAERGTASRSTYERLESWLNRFAQTTDDDGSEPPARLVQQIEVVIEGDFGVKVTVRGPSTDHEVIERAAAQIIRSIRDGDRKDSDPPQAPA